MSHNTWKGTINMTITGNKFAPEFFFVSPMEVVKVTTENMEETAKWCGGEIAETESRRVKGRMDKYVWVPTPKGTKISWAFPGMYISKRMVVTLKDELVVTYSVFRKDYFTKNYFNTPNQAVEATWERADRVNRKVIKAQEAAAALNKVAKKANGASIEQIMGNTPTEMVLDECLPTELASTDIAGVPETDGTAYVQVTDGGRETPHSPLPEPREAEEHERIAEETAGEPDAVLEGDLTPDLTISEISVNGVHFTGDPSKEMTPVEIYHATKAIAGKRQHP